MHIIRGTSGVGDAGEEPTKGTWRALVRWGDFEFLKEDDWGIGMTREEGQEWGFGREDCGCQERLEAVDVPRIDEQMGFCGFGWGI